METVENAEKRYTMRPSVLVVGIVMTGLVCLLPFSYVLDLGPGPDYIKALVWEYTNDPWFSGFRIVSAGAFLASLLCTIPRFIFLYQMIRYYLSKITKKPLILTGIVSELFPTLVSAVLIAGFLLGWTYPLPPLSDDRLSFATISLPLYVPIPLLLIFGLGLVFVLPPRAARD